MLKKSLRLIVGAGGMGEAEAKKCGFKCKLWAKAKKKPHRKTRKTLQSEMAESGVDLLVFCGGDGTARDILKAVGLKVPVLGVPTGVKMHSAVFAVNSASCRKSCRQLPLGRVAFAGG